MPIRSLPPVPPTSTPGSDDHARHRRPVPINRRYSDGLLALEDGDYVAVHSRLRRAGDDTALAVVHIFRFERGHIAELWDIVQAVPAQPVNCNGMF